MSAGGIVISSKTSAVTDRRYNEKRLLQRSLEGLKR